MVVPSVPVTATVTVFSPVSQVAELPFSISVPLSLTTTVAFGLVGVAVTLFDAFVVLVV